MANPVLVEVLRGDLLESSHRGAVFVCDASGRAVIDLGNTEQPVFPRSAVKAIQALPLIETGAADALAFGNRELALACASHSGETVHAELSGAMLATVGLDEGALECGSHWPLDHHATLALARAGGKPSQLHNNCSGKHAGFLCACRHVGIDPVKYVEPGHPYQEMVRRALEEVTGAAHDQRNRATDGCSIPTYAVPIRSLALGFARMATGSGMPATRARAAERLLAACMAEPFLVAGSGRADVDLMRAAPGGIFVKTGAEGVYCAAVPELGLGIALKCDDGAGRAAEAMIAAVLAGLFRTHADVSEKLHSFANQPVVSRAGASVGRVRPAGVLSLS